MYIDQYIDQYTSQSVGEVLLYPNYIGRYPS